MKEALKIFYYFIYMLFFIIIVILLFIEKKYLGATIVFVIGTVTAYVTLVRGLWG